MHGYVLQDWITLSSSPSAQTLVQDAAEWLDLTDYRDLQIWLDVRDADPASVATIAVQHAPLRDDYYFSTLESFSIAGAGVTVHSYMADYVAANGQMPLTRWLRWSVSLPASSGNLTFRIVVAAGGVGSGEIPSRLLSRLVEEPSS